MSSPWQPLSASSASQKDEEILNENYARLNDETLVLDDRRKREITFKLLIFPKGVNEIALAMNQMINNRQVNAKDQHNSDSETTRGEKEMKVKKTSAYFTERQTYRPATPPHQAVIGSQTT